MNTYREYYETIFESTCFLCQKPHGKQELMNVNVSTNALRKEGETLSLDVHKACWEKQHKIDLTSALQP